VKKWDVRLVGAGNQGLIEGGVILAQAAVCDGNNVVQSQKYGLEMRDGAGKVEVIISDSEIHYPRISKADILLAMSQKAYDKYAPHLKEEGVLIIDSTQVKSSECNLAKQEHSIPISEIAVEETGTEMMANIVAVGAIAGITRIVTEGALKEAVLRGVSTGKEVITLKALNAGLDAGARLKTFQVS